MFDKLIQKGLVRFQPRRGRGRPPHKEDKFEEVSKLMPGVGMSEACRQCGVSRQGYYAYLKRKNDET